MNLRDALREQHKRSQERQTKKRGFLGGLLNLLKKLLGNKPKPKPEDPPPPGGGPTPTPDPDPGPEPQPDPTPELFPAIEGKLLLEVTGIDKLPFARDRDDFVIGCLTWEQEGAERDQPILGIHARGTTRNQAGLILRWSANLAHDDNVFKQFHDDRPDLYCGSGMNYYHRVGPLRDGVYEIHWDRDEIGVKTPDGKWARLPLATEEIRVVNGEREKVWVDRRGTAGFARWVDGCPWKRGVRYLLWEQFSGYLHGLKTRIVSFEGKRGTPRPCP